VERKNPKAPDLPENVVASAEYLTQLFDVAQKSAEFARTRDVLDALSFGNTARVALRAWDREWGHYEERLVRLAREHGIADAEIARSLGLPRQNLHRTHGRRGNR
jgi:hypothetical protein